MASKGADSYSSDWKVRMLWAKRWSSLFHPLNINILREVSAYFPTLPILTIVKFGRVIAFNLAEERPLWSWTPDIDVNGAVTMSIDEDRVFLCGGYVTTKASGYVAESAYILAHKSLRQLQSMSTARLQLALWIENQTVFAFGGFDAQFKIQRSCERYSLRANQWSACGEMHRPRTEFNACSLGSLVYLCGGRSHPSESFSPATLTFTLLPFLDMQHCYLVAPYGDKLAVLTKDGLQVWDLTVETLMRSVASTEHKLVGTVKVHQKFAYQFEGSQMCIVKLDMNTGLVYRLPV